MRWDGLADEDCSLARSLAVVGDRWTLLVLREAFLRVRRFDDFQTRLGIARRVLTERLALLVAEGVLEKVQYSERPVRHEYRLTEKGLELYPVIIALVHWGDRHYTDDCGHDFTAVLTCSECGERVDPREVTVHGRACAAENHPTRSHAKRSE